MPKDSSHALLLKPKREEFINVSSVVSLPLLPLDEELRDELLAYVNVRSKKYMNILLDG